MIYCLITNSWEQITELEVWTWTIQSIRHKVIPIMNISDGKHFIKKTHLDNSHAAYYIYFILCWIE